MSTDEIVYRNMMHLLEKNGISERMCTTCCNLNPNFFVNYRKGRTKHFRVCDLKAIADFFEVTIDYLCKYSNSCDDFFRPNYKLKVRDEKVLLYNFRKLDPEGRINVADAISAEMEKSRKRIKYSRQPKQQKA